MLHEKRDVSLPNARQRINGESIIPVRIGLRQSDLHTGYERLMDISHPASENYGKHLSKEQVHSIFAPTEETTEIVKTWLLDSGLVNHSEILHYENKGWLAINVPARHAEILLGTLFYEFESYNGDIRIGCDEYYLPRHVSSHVDYITPAVKLSPPIKKRKSFEKRDFPADNFNQGIPPPTVHDLPPDLRNCGVKITLACIKALYAIPDTNYSQPENAMGLYEIYDAYSKEDISLYFQKFAPNVPANTTPDVISIDGGTAPVATGSERNTGESTADLDLATSLIYPQSVTIYQVDDNLISSRETNFTSLSNTFLDSIDGSYCEYSAFGITGDSPGIDAFYPDPAPGGYKGQRQCGTHNLTRVISISYGESEVYYPKAYVERQCNEMLKLGLQGHTILAASGDYGVAGSPGSNGNADGCLGAAGLNTTIYNPDYPASCPYVTAVGSTRLYPNNTVYDPESACQVDLNVFYNKTLGKPYSFAGTGGGFSNYFAPASFQAQAVNEYLNRDLPFKKLPYYEINSGATNIGENGGVYNRLGRGYPDVSANGAFFLMYSHGTEVTTFGTSLSSPVFGAVVTLLNEERTAIGKASIGFINPALYASKLLLSYLLIVETKSSKNHC